LIEVKVFGTAGGYSSPSTDLAKSEVIMGNTLRRILVLFAVLSPLGIAGCASQSEIDALRSDLTKTQATADAAAADARVAKEDAAAAKASADTASRSANDVSRKADRMYNRSLRK
jgi:outer membrane murein-binding lipoprotein Lpp